MLYKSDVLEIFKEDEVIFIRYEMIMNPLKRMNLGKRIVVIFVFT